MIFVINTCHQHANESVIDQNTATDSNGAVQILVRGPGLGLVAKSLGLVVECEGGASFEFFVAVSNKLSRSTVKYIFIYGFVFK